MNVKNITVDLDSVEECQKVINDLKSAIGQIKNVVETDSKRNFNVDYNSIEDCKKHINILKSRMGELKSSKEGSRNQKKKDQFDACCRIYNTDLNDLYSNFGLDENPNYYVYIHAEQDKKIAMGKCGITSFAASIGMKHIPFYVGKGTGNRYKDLNRNETHRKIRQKLNKFNKDIEVEIVKDNLTEKEALILESKLIDIFGLLPNGGRLVNLDEGIKSEERKSRYIEDLSVINTLYKELLFIH